jgi:putative radical SAM enzyme (TIGR03279 family)
MPRASRATRGGLVSAVLPGSIGAEVGIEPGDRLLSINGQPLRDVLDVRYLSAEENLILVVERAGERHRLQIERDDDENLGLEFAEPLFDGLHRCNNACPFCFVQQMPQGLRPTLYLHDDDYRFSFLLGNFVTLTNLAAEDWQRIGEQHLSPLYVSVHATDPVVRRAVLGNPAAPEIIPQLRRLGTMGIAVHAQVVISPGLNDGRVLERTIADLAALWPTVRTLAVVPVGLTCHQRQDLRSVGAEEAAALLDLLAALAPDLRQRFGCTWLYPADELYLLAARPIPSRAFYDDPAQQENGVGLVRLLLDDWQRARRRLHRLAASPPTEKRNFAVSAGSAAASPSLVTLACGTLIAPVLVALAADLAACAGLRVQTVPVTNHLFGETVTVSGLLAGHDLLAALQERDLGQRVYVPRAMFDATAHLTLDNLSQEDLSARLGVPVIAVSNLSQVLASIKGSSSRKHL